MLNKISDVYTIGMRTSRWPQPLDYYATKDESDVFISRGMYVTSEMIM
jgi:hypothetical protein